MRLMVINLGIKFPNSIMEHLDFNSEMAKTLLRHVEEMQLLTELQIFDDQIRTCSKVLLILEATNH